MSREGTAHTTESRRSGSPVKKGKLTPEEVNLAFDGSQVLISLAGGGLSDT